MAGRPHSCHACLLLAAVCQRTFYLREDELREEGG